MANYCDLSYKSRDLFATIAWYLRTNIDLLIIYKNTHSINQIWKNNYINKRKFTFCLVKAQLQTPLLKSPINYWDVIIYLILVLLIAPFKE